MGDETDEAAVTLFTRIAKSGIIEKLLPLIVAGALGVTGGAASHRVEDAGEHATVNDNREKILDYQAQLNDAKAGFTSYFVKTNEEMSEKDKEIRELHDAVVTLQAQVGMLKERVK